MTIEMARLTQTTAQGIPRVADTVVAFDTLDFDTTSGRMPSVANNRLTASTPGAYLVTGSIRYNAATASADKVAVGARIRNTAAQGINNGVDTQVLFSTADSDNSLSNGMTNQNANSLTAQGSGLHVITGHIRWTQGGAGSGQWWSYIRLNNNVVEGMSTSSNAAGWANDNNVSAVIGLSAGDVITLWCWQGTGFGQNTDPGAGGATLSMVGPLDFTGSERYLSIWKNGNTNLRQAESNNWMSLGRSALTVSSIANMAAGDYIDLRAYHAAVTTSLNTDPAFNDINLSMALLSPT